MMPLETKVAGQPAAAAPELTIGSLLSRSFSVWWNNLFRFAGFTVVLLLPVVLVFAVLGVGVAVSAFGRGGGEPSAPAVGAIIGMVVIGVPLVLVAVVVQMGGLTYGAAQHLAGQPVRFGSMFSVGFRRLLPLVGAGIVATLLIWIGMVLLIVPGIILACGLMVTVAVVVSEDVGPIDALKRSWSLTSGYRWQIFLAGLVLFLVQFGINLASNVLALIPILGMLAALFIQILVASLSTVLPAVAYHDLREVKEGASTEDLARVFE